MYELLNFKKEKKEIAPLVKEVREDFERRRDARRSLEAQWLLNLNFMQGNQYSELNCKQELVDYGKRYSWESREVYNHIAPLVESRLAKFTRVNSSVNVRPSGETDEDVAVARTASRLIETTFLDNDFYHLNGLANYWAELTGTAFYKVIWSEETCSPKIVVCPSYELYPDSLRANNLEDCLSLIHAKAYSVAKIEDIWGVKVEAEQVDYLHPFPVENDLTPLSSVGDVENPHRKRADIGEAIVIEKYVLPTRECPDGRLIIVAGTEVVYDGKLPFINGEHGRTYPFVRQVFLHAPQSFFGTSIIERLIPVQRAFNAVKNRKHEFMSRLSSGVLAVEEGSIDVDDLEEEGLAPGKIILFRQGATPPMLMSPGSVPQEFRDEEDRLLAEFHLISGVSDSVSLQSTGEATVSGYALSLLLEQDYNRLSVTTESIRQAVKGVARMVLRLYAEFASNEKPVRIIDEEGNVSLGKFKSLTFNAEDVIMESDSTMVETPATRKTMVLELLSAGLLGDENGKISNRNRAKIVEMLGFGNWESARSDEQVHIRKADLENATMLRGERVEPDDVDDHAIHVTEHVNAYASGYENMSEQTKKNVRKHIAKHKVLLKLEATANALPVTVKTENERR